LEHAAAQPDHVDGSVLELYVVTVGEVEVISALDI
jgi:hypothetical protein